MALSYSAWLMMPFSLISLSDVNCISGCVGAAAAGLAAGAVDGAGGGAAVGPPDGVGGGGGAGVVGVGGVIGIGIGCGSAGGGDGTGPAGGGWALAVLEATRISGQSMHRHLRITRRPPSECTLVLACVPGVPGTLYFSWRALRAYLH